MALPNPNHFSYYRNADVTRIFFCLNNCELARIVNCLDVYSTVF